MHRWSGDGSSRNPSGGSEAPVSTKCRRSWRSWFKATLSHYDQLQFSNAVFLLQIIHTFASANILIQIACNCYNVPVSHRSDREGHMTRLFATGSVKWRP